MGTYEWAVAVVVPLQCEYLTRERVFLTRRRENEFFDEKTRERMFFLTKAAIKRVQNDACISYAEREQARPKVKEREDEIFCCRCRGQQVYRLNSQTPKLLNS